MADNAFGPNQLGGGTVNDEPVASDDHQMVINQVLNARDMAWDAKWSRMVKNRRNMDAYLGKQDWSFKQDGQSTEFIPKTSVAVEAMGNFIKRGLLKFGPWYSARL